MNNINNLNSPSISGVQTLNLDELVVAKIDGDVIYYNRIEGNEIIVVRNRRFI